MAIFVGGTNITDIKIGSTTINSVWVGANQVWSRAPALSLTASPASGNAIAYGTNFSAGAQVNISTTPSTSVSFTFTVNSTTGNGSLFYGSSTGTSTHVRLVQIYSAGQSEVSTANVTVSASVGGSVIATKVCTLRAETIFVNEGGG